MAVNSYDIVSTFQYMGMMKYWKGKHILLKRQVRYSYCMGVCEYNVTLQYELILSRLVYLSVTTFIDTGRLGVPFICFSASAIEW